jgi:hypothetical protein
MAVTILPRDGVDHARLIAAAGDVTRVREGTDTERKEYGIKARRRSGIPLG